VATRGWVAARLVINNIKQRDSDVDLMAVLKSGCFFKRLNQELRKNEISHKAIAKGWQEQPNF